MKKVLVGIISRNDYFCFMKNIIVIAIVILFCFFGCSTGVGDDSAVKKGVIIEKNDSLFIDMGNTVFEVTNEFFPNIYNNF